jgi:hypothetical protein
MVKRGHRRTGPKHQKEKRSMDHFAGLDVSVKETSICIVDDTGKIVRAAGGADRSCLPLQADRTGSWAAGAMAVQWSCTGRSLYRAQARSLRSASAAEGAGKRQCKSRRGAALDALEGIFKRYRAHPTIDE